MSDADLDALSTARLELDLDRPGTSVGRIALAHSTNISAWGELYIPVVAINGGPGPTVLLIGGTHGDEYEGQLTLLRLAQELSAEDVTGRILMIPRISGEASAGSARLWPDGSNLNRAFPGAILGSAASRLADYLTRKLFPLADAVIDIHSGGRSMRFAPMATIHVPEDPVLRAGMLDAAAAWLTDLCYVQLFAADGAGLLNEEAQKSGTVVATAELGGAGITTVETLAIARRGLVNLLRHFGVLTGTPSTRQGLGLPPTAYVEIAGPANYLRARDRGLFEPAVEPGASVAEGTVLGHLRFPDFPDRAADTIRAPMAGVVCVLRSLPSSEIGDCLAVVGRVMDGAALR